MNPNFPIHLSHMHPEEELLAAQALEQLRYPRKSVSVPESPLGTRQNEDIIMLSQTESNQAVARADREVERSEVDDTLPKSESNSLWKSMIATATAMVIPAQETQKRLTYFLRMLRLANEHLSQKVTALQEVVDAENQGIEPKISASAVKQDIVATVRKSMDVIMTFASDSLPERARYAVRFCLLSLPQRWACSMDADTDANHAGESAALSLATEALAMIQTITGIVDSTLTRADSWCQNLGKRPRSDADPDEETDNARIRSALALPPLVATTSTDSEGSIRPLSPKFAPL